MTRMSRERIFHLADLIVKGLGTVSGVVVKAPDDVRPESVRVLSEEARLDDSIDGEAGDDIIFGGVGNDILIAGSGENQLFGQNGNDTIFAQDGNLDFIDGGAGSDSAEIDNVDLLSSIETII